MDIPLFMKHIYDPVDVRCKGTYDPDTGNIIYVLYHVINGGFIAMALQFLYDALRRFDPRLDMFDRIILMRAEIHHSVFPSLSQAVSALHCRSM